MSEKNRQCGCRLRQSDQSIGKQRGYILVEVMTALMISVIGITGLSASITTAARLGTTAQQSGAVTIANRTTFSHLRLFLPGSLVSPVNFNLGAAATTPPADFLQQNLQQVVDDLALDFVDARSDIACAGNTVVTCRVCFHWYDSGKHQPAVDTAQGATNRSSCQIQIV